MDDRERYIVDLERELAQVRRQLAECTGEPILVRRLGKPAPRRRVKHEDQSRFGRASRRAETRGKTWELSRETYETLVEQPCDYCGDPTGDGVGLDRLDNTRGYEPDNVVPCCGDCNMLRGRRLTPEQTRKAIRAIRA